MTTNEQHSDSPSIVVITLVAKQMDSIKNGLHSLIYNLALHCFPHQSQYNFDANHTMRSRTSINIFYLK